METTSGTDWHAVARYARREFNRLRKAEDFHGHPSFAVVAAMEKATERFGVGYGVEGFCDTAGRAGLNYVNMGDPYVTTVIATCSRYGDVRFSVGCWGDYAENPKTARKYGLDK